ncbi:MAG TPA: sigma-70 family RNA polymerase sigma factor [Pirellulales bacterium]|nr:sigma-70 family RNA polymerase sigma factor [Pirellulales bacterium]
MNRTTGHPSPEYSPMGATLPGESDSGTSESGPADCDAGDGDILQEFREGREAEAVRRLFQRHGGRVRSALRRRFPSIHDDHILLQSLHDAVGAVLAGYDPAKGVSLGGWFLLIAGRRVCDALRGQRERRRKTFPLVDDCYDVRPSPTSRMLSDELREAVRRAMEHLSELERAVIEADIDAGKQASADVLARRLKTTDQSIYAARARARRKLLESPVLKRAVR